MQFIFLNFPDLVPLYKFFMGRMIHDSRITMAVAMDFKWERDRWMTRIPIGASIFSVVPEIRNDGLPFASCTISISFHCKPLSHPLPTAFRNASLAANRAA